MTASNHQMTSSGTLQIRSDKRQRPARPNATAVRCHALNSLVERSIADLRLPATIERAVLSPLRFSEEDFHKITVLEARSGSDSTVAIAAWEPLVETGELEDPRILILRCVCVDPSWQGSGIGSSLVESVVQAADDRGVSLILTYAWPSAAAFFARHTFQPVPSDFNLDEPLRPLALRLANGSA